MLTTDYLNFIPNNLKIRFSQAISHIIQNERRKR